MTETNRGSEVSNRRTVAVDPALAEGRSRLALFAGMFGFALGSTFEVVTLAVGSVVVIAAAFVLNTLGKVSHYNELDIPWRAQIALSGSWGLLATTVVALLGTYTYARYGSGSGQFFWSLAVAGIGFGLLHMAAQSICLEGVDTQ